MASRKPKKTAKGTSRPARRDAAAAPPAAKRTYVLFLLDGSGSMQTGLDGTIKGYNEQVDIVREAADGGGDTRVSLICFADSIPLPRFLNEPASALSKLDHCNYQPNGGTPLYDAVGYALDTAERFAGIDDPETAVLVALFTDGEDTTSNTWRNRIPELGARVQALTDTGRWTFTLMGPRHKLAQLADELRIPAGNVSGFDPVSVASRGVAMASMATATTAYMAARSVGQTQVLSLYADAQARQGEAP